MNPLKLLCENLRRQFPSATLAVFAPALEDGMWSLDVDLGNTRLAIEWSAITGFGVSTVSNENFGETSDEAFDTLEEASQRITHLLATGERTSPPLPVLLARLRERRGVTQEELARRLGVKQATISGMERRDDVQLSTLRRFLHALGGRLEVMGIFPDCRFLIDISTADAKERPSPPLSVVPLSSARRVRTFQYERVFSCLQATGQLPSARHTASIISQRGTLLEFAE